MKTTDTASITLMAGATGGAGFAYLSRTSDAITIIIITTQMHAQKPS